ncbi:pickpocket protein 28 [Anopheles maculipalpis]|uniref:pickpocket protein 28 n=1 Tax=Anopheles maculipalpis TaxID=1496333 RepID=UPI002159AD5A|nr:pickpocket protein 28 [Anopheles maculipalpis]
MAPVFPALHNNGRLPHGAFDKELRTRMHNERVSFTENLREYCLNTTIHGLKYIGTVSLTLCERAYFFLTFLVVTACSIYFISNVYIKWQSSPIIIGLNPIATHIKNIPFPAVTICNMNQVRREAAERIEQNTLEQSVLQSICSIDGDFNVTQYEGKWTAVKKLLLSATQPCSGMLKACRYAKQPEKCSEIFQSVFTDEGLCCTFNTLDTVHMFQNASAPNIFPTEVSSGSGRFRPILWTPEQGYADHPSNTTYPRVIAGTGVTMGLAMVLDANVTDYYCSSTSSTGFKIIFHSPTETPKITDYAQYIPVGSENRIIITPKINDAADQIRKVAQAQRQCVFASEANLSYYSVYSRNNCELECEAQLILENCGCVLYYLPKLYEDTKICSRANARCYEQIRSSIAFTANDSLSCTCLPGCFEISYIPDVTTAELQVGQFGIRESLLDDVKDEQYAKKNLALIYVFVKDTYYRSFTKGELVGFTDFLSNVGGLLGLFLGFSIISLIEVIYFVTLRPYCAKRKQPRTNVKDHHLEAGKLNAARNDLLWFGSKPSNATMVQFLGQSNDPNDYHLQARPNAMVKAYATKLKYLVHSRLQQASGWMRNTFRSRRNRDLGRGFGQERTGIRSYPFYD